MSVGLPFDALLAGGIVYLAWRSAHAHSLFAGIVLFIAFGLLMALAWVRLGAVDIALAEAAIGAGLTGALLLDALGHVKGGPGDERDDDEDGLTLGRPGRALAAALATGVTVVLALAVWWMPRGEDGLHAAVVAALAEHPVGNAATAVLLDFRAYDTFLEMGVLALAGLGAFLLQTRTLRQAPARPPSQGSVVLRAMVVVLVPMMLMTAAYLYWAGTSLSGGAFPAGAMLAGAMVITFLAGIGHRFVRDDALTRAALAGGLAAFLVAGGATLGAGRTFLEWGGWTYPAMLAVEAALTLSIGATLGLLYVAAAKAPPETKPERADG